MNKPLVSIGVPTYNRPKTLERTLRSLVSQTYENLEIIVSDNGSNDKCVSAVLSEFESDNRVKIFRHKSNRGATFNFNFILNQFNGTYVMRIGDDDWIDSNYIESCLSYLVENPDCVCAYGRTKIFDLESKFLQFDTELNLCQATAGERMKYYYESVTQNGIYFGLLKKECISYIRTDRLLADDWLGVARLCFIGKIKMLPSTCLNITTGGTGRSVDSIVDGLGLSSYNRYFPYFSVCLNIYRDIVWKSRVYRVLNLSERIKLANTCVNTIKRRFNVKAEIRGNFSTYLKSFWSKPSSN